MQYPGDPSFFPPNFSLVDDSLPPTGAAFNPALEALGDRTAWLLGQTSYLALRNSSYQSIVDATPGALSSFAEWNPGASGFPTDTWTDPTVATSATLDMGMFAVPNDVLDVTITGNYFMNIVAHGPAYVALAPWVLITPPGSGATSRLVTGCTQTFVQTTGEPFRWANFTMRGAIVATDTGAVSISLKSRFNLLSHSGAGVPNSFELCGDLAVYVQKYSATGRVAT